MPLTDEQLPRLVTVRQRLHQAPLDESDIVARTREGVRAATMGRIRPGMSVAVGAGSRGIANYALIVKATVDELTALGARPFIFPAMGSHGGATAEGQTGVLATLGVTAAAMGAPIRAGMETIELGRAPCGLPVYLDAIAAAADGIVVVNRIKPHTNFRGHIESGLMKMLAIGTGKRTQADAIHKLGVRAFTDWLPEIGRVVMDRAPVLAGVGIIEDAVHQTADVAVLTPGTLELRESELLARVKSWSPRLPVDRLDLLVVERIGKDISGTGMDTNVIGRCQLIGFHAFPTPVIDVIVALGLTEATHGNAIGMGLADLITRRIADAIDTRSTYVNVITGQCPKNGAMPPVMANDREAIATALDYLVVGRKPHEATVIRLRDTLSLAEFQVSEALAGELRGRDGIEIVGEAQPMRFAADGTLL